MILQTERTYLRPVLESDFDDLYKIVGDRESMKYIREPETEEEFRKRMTMWAEYTEKCPELGTFVIVLRETDEFVGFCVMRHVEYKPENGEYEVGYLITKNKWGRGFATEVTSAMCAYLKEKVNPTYLVAFTDHENIASQKVLEKNGFAKYGDRELYEAFCLELRLYF